MGFHAAAANCASSRHSILRLWRGPSPRAYARGIISHGLSCRCGELCLFEALHPAPLARPFSKGLRAGDYLTWAFMPLRRTVPLRGLHPAPLARPFSKGLHAGIISHRLSCRCDELCLFEALHPAPLARPFSKGLLEGIISHGLSCRCDELCLFEALHPAPLARPFSKGLRAGDYLTRAFMPLQRIVPLRGTLSCAFGAALLQGPTRRRNILVPSHSFFISFSDGVK